MQAGRRKRGKRQNAAATGTNNANDHPRGGKAGNHCTASTLSSNAGAASVAVNGLRKAPVMPASRTGRGYRAHREDSDEKRVGRRPIKLQLMSTASAVVSVIDTALQPA